MRLVRVFFASAFFLAAAAVWARDFPEPFPALDPLYAGTEESGLRLAPGEGYSEAAYVPHSISGSDDDTFEVRGLGSFTLLRYGAGFAVGVRFGSYILVGPIGEGESAPTVAEWWMNAAQYEYGATVAAGAGPAHVILEYSRTSQHPWRARFSEVTTDAVKAGVSVPRLRAGPFRADLRIEAGYVDLFDFWKSAVPKPRAEWVASPAALLSLPLIRGVSVFAKVQSDLIILRSGGSAADLWAESGLSFGSGSGAAQVFLDYYSSADTEELRDGPSRASLVGIGFRLSR